MNAIEIALGALGFVAAKKIMNSKKVAATPGKGTDGLPNASDVVGKESTFERRVKEKRTAPGSGNPVYIESLKSSIINRGAVPKIIAGSGDPRYDEAVLEEQLFNLANDTMSKRKLEDQPQAAKLDSAGYKVLMWEIFKQYQGTLGGRPEEAS